MPAILQPALFVFVWQAAPSPAGSMFYFYTNRLGFTPEFVGRIKLLDGIAQLLGEPGHICTLALKTGSKTSRHRCLNNG